MLQLFYGICDLFQVLLIRAFVNRMLKYRQKRYITESLWIITFILDEIWIYFINDSKWNMVVATVLELAVICIGYSGKKKDKVFTFLFMDVSLIVSEALVYIIINTFFEVTAEIYLLGGVMSKIVLCIFLRGLMVLKKDIKEVNISFKMCVDIFAIPFITSAMLLCQYYLYGGFRINKVEIVYCSLMLVINYIAFEMFMDIKQVMSLRHENRLLEEQKKYYIGENKETKQLWEGMRSFKHDVRNRYTYEKILLEEGRYAELMAYYQEVIKFLKSDRLYASSGNMIVDSMINYKLSDISEDIEVECIMHFPEDLQFNEGDIVLIFGNLIDNALEALKGINNGKKWLSIKLEYDQPNLVMIVANTYQGALKKDNQGNYLTTKKDKKNHGIGIKNVSKLVNMRGGMLAIKENDGIFEVRVHIGKT